MSEQTRRAVFELADVESFEVEDDKVTKFLLNLDHAKGRERAIFFGKIGFHAGNPDLLIGALFAHLLGESSVVSTKPNRLGFGLDIVAVGPLVGPAGTSPSVRTIWLREPNHRRGRFITAYGYRTGARPPGRSDA